MKYVIKDNQIFGYDAHQSDLYQQALNEGAAALSTTEMEAILNPPLTAEQHLDNQRMSRRVAYQRESDPLFIEWQYDQTDQKEAIWRDKVQQIKQRYPLEMG